MSREDRAYVGLAICLALSGSAGLVYEVAWTRSLELVFGATTLAVATVLAAFMGGLALGAWLMARASHRLERFRPLRVYATLEALLAATALLVPLALRLQAPLFQALGGRLQDSFVGLCLLRLLLSAAILVPPAALMGATLPIASRAVSGSGRGTERRVGTLYAVNTLGAVLGAAGAGLLLLPSIGLLRTQILAVVLNLLAAASAFVLAAGTAPPRTAAAPPPTGPRDEPSPVAPFAPAAAGQGLLLVALYAISGTTAMIYEVAWSRLLVLVLGSSTYAYTIMLATFLSGLALGAWLGVRALAAVRDPALAAGLCQILVAIGTFLGLFLVEELPFLYHVAHDRLRPEAAGLLGIQWLLAASLMILPTLGLGAMFPVTLGGLEMEGRRAPGAVGRAYAWNTLGAILGSLAAGFWLVPRLGSRGALLAAIVVNTLLAVVAVLGSRAALRPRLRRLLVGAILVFGLNLFVGAPDWRPEILSSGIFRYVDRYQGMDRATFLRKAREHHGEILMFREGLTCTVTVFRTTSALTLMVNGKPDASVPPGLADPSPRARPVAPGDLPTQVLLGQIPLLLAPDAERVMVIGLGSGVTLGSTLTHPVRRADCVELEDAVVRASRFFDAHSGAPLADARVRLVVNDARNELLLAKAPYDVIISEPSNPWIAGAASLFTREFFEVARARLAPGGVFCQWVQLYELRPEDFRAMLRSFTAVFPGVHVFRAGFDAILVGAERPLPIRADAILARAPERARADLARVGIRTPEELLARYWIGGEELLLGLPPGPLNTDDNMLVEFKAPLRMLARDARRQEEQMQELAGIFRERTRGILPHVAPPEGGPGAAGAFYTRVAEASLALGLGEEALLYLARSLESSRDAQAARLYGEALARTGRPDQARAWLDMQVLQYPHEASLLRAAAELSARQRDWLAVRDRARAMLKAAPKDAAGRYLLGQSLFRLGDMKGALALLEPLRPALDEATMPDLAFLLGASCASAGRPAEAVIPLREHLRRHPGDAAARSLLAGALARAGRAEEALAESRRLSPGAGRRAAALLERARTDWNEGRVDRARTHLEEARQFDPENEEVALLLAAALARLGERARAIEDLEAYLAASPDHPAVTGYLSQLMAEAGEADRARLLAARYVAMTGESWQAIDGGDASD